MKIQNVSTSQNWQVSTIKKSFNKILNTKLQNFPFVRNKIIENQNFHITKWKFGKVKFNILREWKID